MRRGGGGGGGLYGFKFGNFKIAHFSSNRAESMAVKQLTSCQLHSVISAKDRNVVPVWLTNEGDLVHSLRLLLTGYSYWWSLFQPWDFCFIYCLVRNGFYILIGTLVAPVSFTAWKWKKITAHSLALIIYNRNGFTGRKTPSYSPHSVPESKKERRRQRRKRSGNKQQTSIKTNIGLKKL